MTPWLLWIAFQPPLTLPEALRRAVAAHPVVEAARHEAGAARARTAETAALRRPRVEFAEAFTRGDNPVYAFGTLLTQRQFTQRNFGLGALNRPDFVNNFQSLLRLEQPLFDGGRARHAAAGARAGAQAAEAGVRAAEETLLVRTAESYWGAWVAAEAVMAAEQSIRSVEASLARARDIRDAGRATDADVLAAEVQLAQAREERIQREADRRNALAALNEAIDLPLDSEHTLSVPPTMNRLTIDVTLGARPALEAEQARVAQAEVSVQSARAAVLPVIGAMGALEADRQRFVTRAGANWLAGVTLRWTPYQGGADRARRTAAAETLASAKSREQAVARRLELERWQSEQAMEAAVARVATTEKAIEMAQESLRITRDRYGAGLTPMTDVLRAESALYDARLRRAGALHALRLAQLAVVTARGRLTPDSEIFQ